MIPLLHKGIFMLGAFGIVAQDNDPGLIALAACLAGVALAIWGFSRLRRHDLAEEAARFRTVADCAFEGLIFERDGRIASLNRAMADIIGPEATALVGGTLTDLLPDIANRSPTA